MVDETKDIKEMTEDYSKKLLMCPYCPRKSKNSHRTASYKVKVSKEKYLMMKCKGCQKQFKVVITGEFIFRDELIHPVNPMEEMKNDSNKDD